jgi:hypothetical protein
MLKKPYKINELKKVLDMLVKRKTEEHLPGAD